MAELSETQARMVEPPIVEATGPVGQANRRMLDFLYGAQRVALEDAPFGRVQLETGGRSFGQQCENHVRGMRPAPDRLHPPRLRPHLQAQPTDGRRGFEPVHASHRKLTSSSRVPSAKTQRRARAADIDDRGKHRSGTAALRRQWPGRTRAGCGFAQCRAAGGWRARTRSCAAGRGASSRPCLPRCGRASHRRGFTGCALACLYRLGLAPGGSAAAAA